ncbi:MAG: hypothetical protein K8S94_03790 [Planctomycetia bacterium]|nr:hypothetical protein [Planctomycetia bacterium]
MLLHSRRPLARVSCSLIVVASAVSLIATLSAAAEEKVTFIDNALPVLRQRCGSCHNPDKKTGGLDITSYAAIMRGGGSGEVIAPGDAAASHLFRVANHDDEPTMPPDAPPIPEAERQVLRNWINGGVLETKGSVAVAAKKVEVAMSAPATERPAVSPMPARLPLEPVVHTQAIDACASLAASPWSPLVAVCGQKQILLYRTDTLDLAGVLPFPEGRPHVVRFSGGGGLVIAGGGVGAQSGKVVVWNVKSGRRIRTLGDELDVVLAADVSPDQRLVAFGGPQKVVRLHSLETGEKLHDLPKHTDWILATAFSPDGKLLASADRAGNVIVWQAATGRDSVTPAAHPSAVTSLAWRGDSKLLATGCDDGQIRLWEPENGTLVKAWPAHGGGVAAIDFTRDGRLVSVGRDKTPKLWKPDGSQERAFEAGADVGLAAASCDETNRLVVGDWTGEIRIYNAADGARVGGLDPNPPALAERVAVAERGLSDRKAKLDEAVAALRRRRVGVGYGRSQATHRRAGRAGGRHQARRSSEAGRRPRGSRRAGRATGEGTRGEDRTAENRNREAPGRPAGRHRRGGGRREGARRLGEGRRGEEGADHRPPGRGRRRGQGTRRAPRGRELISYGSHASLSRDPVALGKPGAQATGRRAATSLAARNRTIRQPVYPALALGAFQLGGSAEGHYGTVLRQPDRGREARLGSGPPPSEPCWRISRTRLSGRWSYLRED